MYSSLENIDAVFQDLEKSLCDPQTFICPPRPPVPKWLWDIKSEDIKSTLAAGCSGGISTSSIIGTTPPSNATNSSHPLGSTLSANATTDSSHHLGSTLSANATTEPSHHLGSTFSANATTEPSHHLGTTLSANATTEPSYHLGTTLSSNVTSAPSFGMSTVVPASPEAADGGPKAVNATIVAGAVIGSIILMFIAILVGVGCLRYHKKKKINPMSNGEPGNYLNNNKKRRWVGMENSQVTAIRNMNGTTPQIFNSPEHSDVENGEERVPSPRKENDINQSQTFTGIAPAGEKVTVETDVKHKKHKRRKKKKSQKVETDGENTLTEEQYLPHKLPPLSIPVSKPV